MSDADVPLSERLAALHAAFAAALPGRVAELETAWSPLSDGHWDAAACRSAMRLAHSLAGAGATFGHPDVSAVAGRIERWLQQALDASRPLDTGQRAEVADALGELRAAASRVGQSAPDGTTGTPCD